MELYDPFEEIDKAYGRGIESPRVRVVSALMPTGRHVGNANALHHTHNSRGGGGPATKLERYSKAMPKFRNPASFTRGERAVTNALEGKNGLHQVVFKKPAAARANRAAVERGLSMATGTYKPPRQSMFAGVGKADDQDHHHRGRRAAAGAGIAAAGTHAAAGAGFGASNAYGISRALAPHARKAEHLAFGAGGGVAGSVGAFHPQVLAELGRHHKKYLGAVGAVGGVGAAIGASTHKKKKVLAKSMIFQNGSGRGQRIA